MVKRLIDADGKDLKSAILIHGRGKTRDAPIFRFLFASNGYPLYSDRLVQFTTARKMVHAIHSRVRSQQLHSLLRAVVEIEDGRTEARHAHERKRISCR